MYKMLVLFMVVGGGRGDVVDGMSSLTYTAGLLKMADA